MSKNWCVYDGIGVGYIEEETQHKDGKITLWIRYSENQRYEIQPWDHRYVDRFETWQAALADFKKYRQSRFRGYSSPEEYIEDNFPTYYKEK